MKKRLSIFLLLQVILLSQISGCSWNSNQTKKASKSGFYFDTIVTVTVYNTDDESIIDECFALADEYEKLLSNTIASSDISRINESPGEYVEVDARTITVLQEALTYCELSDGTFDISIGELSDLWNISNLAENSDAGNVYSNEVLPSDSDINALLEHVGYEHIHISGNSVMIDDDSLKLDLGGIAKGYIADAMKTLLNENGYTEGIINLGGNILTLGIKASGESYSIGIQYPFNDSGEVICGVSIPDGSMVTSGIYERYIKVDDHIYHHILDVNTGYPVQTDLYSVTIYCENSAMGDALSTICLAYGLDKATDFIESMENVEAIFVTNEYQVSWTSGLDGYVTIEE